MLVFAVARGETPKVEQKVSPDWLMTAQNFPEHDGDLGELLRSRRHRRGWSQEQLAHHLEVSTGTVGRWESGSWRVQQHLRPRLATFLDLSHDELNALLGSRTSVVAISEWSGAREHSRAPSPRARLIEAITDRVATGEPLTMHEVRLFEQLLQEPQGPLDSRRA